MGHILISQQGRQLLGLLRIVLSLCHHGLKLIRLHEADATSNVPQLRQDVTHQLDVIVIRMEHGTVLRRGC